MVSHGRNYSDIQDQRVATMEDMDRAGLLSSVLDCLHNPRDITRCSAVSKAWKEASHNSKPETLHVHSDSWSTPQNNVAQARQILQWFQQHQRRGSLCNLRRFHLNMAYQGAEQQQLGALRELWRSFLTLAGLWDLRVCTPAGCFTLESAVELLPSSLLHIALQSTNEPYSQFCMERFVKFPKLHTLRLDIRRDDPVCFFLFATSSREPGMSPLTSLLTLQMHDHVAFVPNNFSTYAGQLPSLRHLECRMEALQLQQIFDIPTLKYASLRVDMQHPNPDAALATVGVWICASSNLRVLTMKPLENPGLLFTGDELRLQLSIDQPLLAYQYVCNDTIIVSHNYNMKYIASVYTPPALFQLPLQ
ncbi:hypothetical protein ABBQ38_005559 [Trebouxia sp. C0009 RCD-2024]